MEQKTGGSSRVANTESRVNLANTESQVTENSANTKSRVTQNSANTESRITENSANTENRVMQDSGGGVGNRKKENVLLQAKCQFHGGAQGVLPRHKNTDRVFVIKKSSCKESCKEIGVELCI
jgi:hypothetical protein